MLKPSALIVNCARGGIIDEDALYEALKERTIAGAALDVFEDEPPKGSKLLTLDNLVATPHLGASTKEAQEKVSIEMAEHVKSSCGKQDTNAVNVPISRWTPRSPRSSGWPSAGAFCVQLSDAPVRKSRWNATARCQHWTPAWSPSPPSSRAVDSGRSNTNLINASTSPGEGHPDRETK
jgi:D-3-phosphoglycerate dehydrogenase